MQRWAGEPATALRAGVPRFGLIVTLFQITSAQGVTLNEKRSFCS